MTKLKIVKVETSQPDSCKVIFSDGTELEGIVSLSTSAGVNEISTVTLTAYILPHKKVEGYDLSEYT